MKRPSVAAAPGAEKDQALLVHRFRSAAYQPSGILHIAVAPYASLGTIPAGAHFPKSYVAVVRESGAVELWVRNRRRFYLEATVPAARGAAPVSSCATSEADAKTASPAEKGDAGETPAAVPLPRLFTSAMDGVITEWDVALLRPRTQRRCAGGAIWSMAVAPDQRALAIGCEDASVALYSIAGPDTLVYERLLARGTTRILSLAWCPPAAHAAAQLTIQGLTDGFLAAGSAKGTVTLVHAPTGKTVRVLKLERAAGEETLVWTLNWVQPHVLVSGDSLGQVTFWNTRHGVAQETLRGHEADVLCVASHRDGSHVFSTGVDRKGARHGVAMRSGADTHAAHRRWAIVGEKRYHTHDVRALALLPSGAGDKIRHHHAEETYLMTGGVDAQLTLSLPINEFPRVRQTRMALFSDAGLIQVARGARLMLARFPEGLKVWHLGSAARPRAAEATEAGGHEAALLLNMALDTDDHPDHLIASAIADDGRYIACASARRVLIFELARLPATATSADRIKVIKRRAAAAVLPDGVGASQLIFTQNGRRLIVLQTDGVVALLDLADGGHITRVHQFTELRGHALAVSALSPDGVWLVASDVENHARLWNLDTFQTHGTLPRNDAPYAAMAFCASDPSLLILATHFNRVYLYNVETRRLDRWSRETLNRHPASFVHRRETIKAVMEFPGATARDRQILVAGESYVCRIDCAPLPKALRRAPVVAPMRKRHAPVEPDAAASAADAAARKPKPTRAHGPDLSGLFHFSERFAPLVYAGFVSQHELLVVERPLLAVLDALPTAFARRKFGRS
ncbi:hypothetical protein CXG81DRAFT_13459 [Caulochytrium protostelioides]|uniref:Uncharacterized protein n=1 Tax=Caulochytrium protostelioides TaxID=1555241 RepID=A0A4P9X558_9FUNG|nr:hypothetical protein CXG81DRAFT_13459 [Caulochytrium protostelioides]|eukprot:RKP00246.1 hypothetical protein CXG81DRAFT_13459 [Caulochytrium protostelioides]